MSDCGVYPMCLNALHAAGKAAKKKPEACKKNTSMGASLEHALRTEVCAMDGPWPPLLNFCCRLSANTFMLEGYDRARHLYIRSSRQLSRDKHS